ncbi:hypothetical protein ABVN80_18215 [Acinetobacter baumannii]
MCIRCDWSKTINNCKNVVRKLEETGAIGRIQLLSLLAAADPAAMQYLAPLLWLYNG